MLDIGGSLCYISIASSSDGAFLECKKPAVKAVITGGNSNESKDYIGMQRMQAEKLRHSKEQEEYT